MIRRAIVLAAGRGSKCFPYGDVRQKCVLPIANVPAVRRLCLSLIEIGVTEIVVAVGHRKQQVMGATADLPGVRFVTQTTLDGTAAAAYAAAETSSEREPLLVVYGDIVLTTEDLRRFVTEFGNSGALAGVLLNRLGEEEPGSWICAATSGGLVTQVTGHPRGGSHRLCGVYAFQAHALPALARNPGIATRVDVGGMPPAESEVAGSIQVLIDDHVDVFASETMGFFVDIDKPWHVLEANARMVEHLTSQLHTDVVADGARISDGADITGHVVVGSNTTIGKRVVLRGNAIVGGNCQITNGAILHGGFVIGNHCRISDYCDVGGRSVVGNRCIIGHGAEFSGVLFDKVYLYHYCEMSGVFGEATDIGAASVCGTLRFDDRDTPHRIGGRTETPSHGADATYMGDFCRTGVNAMLMPGVKVGSYSCVGPGVICYEDVPSGTLLLAKQELITKPWGPSRYGW